MTCSCHVGPGKFEGESVLTFLAYQQMCLGNVDESIGRYDFFKAPFMFDADQSAVKAALDYGYCQECIDDHDDRTLYGLAIHEDDSGFVYCDTFATEAEYDAAVQMATDSEEGDDA